MRGRWVAAFLLLLYMGALAFVLLVPDGGVPSSLLTRTAGGARSIGAPEWLLVADRWAFVSNVMIVIPAAAFASLAWPRRDWTFWTAYGFVGSLGVETVQALVLASRDASFVDVVANTTGALIGAASVGGLRSIFATGRHGSAAR